MTGEQPKNPPDDEAGSDQPSEVADAAESEVDHPTENTESPVPEPDQASEDPAPADLDPQLTHENPDPAGPPSRRPRLSRRERLLRNERRLQEMNSTVIPSPLDNDPASTQSEVDGVVSNGFR